MIKIKLIIISIILIIGIIINSIFLQEKIENFYNLPDYIIQQKNKLIQLDKKLTILDNKLKNMNYLTTYSLNKSLDTLDYINKLHIKLNNTMVKLMRIKNIKTRDRCRKLSILRKKKLTLMRRRAIERRRIMLLQRKRMELRKRRYKLRRFRRKYGRRRRRRRIRRRRTRRRR
jgi:hypothetical protein